MSFGILSLLSHLKSSIVIIKYQTTLTKQLGNLDQGEICIIQNHFHCSQVYSMAFRYTKHQRSNTE